MKITISSVTTFVASVVVGAGAAVAFASAAAVSQAAPTLRIAAPLEVVRLDPVVVTISTAAFDAARAEGTRIARTNDAKKVVRG